MRSAGEALAGTLAVQESATLCDVPSCGLAGDGVPFNVAGRVEFCAQRVLGSKHRDVQKKSLLKRRSVDGDLI